MIIHYNFGALSPGVSVPKEFIPVTLPDGRVLRSPTITSGLEVMARGLEAQGKTAEAAAVRAMDAQGGLAKIPTATVAAPAVGWGIGAGAGVGAGAPAAGGIMTPLALAAGGFFVGGPIGAAAGAAVGFFLGRK